MMRFSFATFAVMAFVSMADAQCPNGQCQAPQQTTVYERRVTYTFPPVQTVTKYQSSQPAPIPEFYYVPVQTFQAPQAGTTIVINQQPRRRLFPRLFGW